MENQLAKVVKSSLSIRYAVMIVSIYGTIQGLTLFYEQHRMAWMSADTVKVVFVLSFVFAFLLEYALVQTEKGAGYARKGTEVRRYIMYLWLFYAFINFLTMSANILSRADDVVIHDPSLQSAIEVRDAFATSKAQLEEEYTQKLSRLKRYRSGTAEKEIREAFEAQKKRKIAEVQKEADEKIEKIEKRRDADVKKYRARDYDGDAKIRANVAWVKTKAKREIGRVQRAAAQRIEAIRAQRPDTKSMQAQIRALEKAIDTVMANKLLVTKQWQNANREAIGIEARLKSEKETELFWNKVYTFLFSALIVGLNFFMSFSIGKVQAGIDGVEDVPTVDAVVRESRTAAMPVVAQAAPKTAPAAKESDAPERDTDTEIFAYLAQNARDGEPLPGYRQIVDALGVRNDDVSRFYKNYPHYYVEEGRKKYPSRALLEAMDESA